MGGPKRKRESQRRASKTKHKGKQQDEMDYPIPKASAEARRSHKARSPQNPCLIFNRFVLGWGQSRDRDAKKKAWDEIEEAAAKADGELLQAWNNRWEATVRIAKAEPFSLKTDWRFVTGLGNRGPLEVGFTFHRYGFPILPGSSVKGIARAWGLVNVAEAFDVENLNDLDKLLTKDEKLEIYPQASANAKTIAENFRIIFGTAGRAGSIIFFDAVPLQKPELQLDIINPHFPDYYSDKDDKVPPTDWQNPRPVYFLTVAPNTEFRFAVGCRESSVGKACELQDLAKKWLVEGLAELGAGAKTSAGYGYFNLI